MKKLNKLKLAFRRPLLSLAALAMLMGVAAPALTGTVNAAELTNRSIQMSSAVPGATGVSYQITFTLDSAAQSVAIDFCQDSSLYRDTACTAPAGLDVSGTSVSGGDTDWAVLSGAPNISATHMEAAGTSEGPGVVTLVFDGITNPTTTGGFFARVYTYSLADPDWTGVGTTGSDVDFGGIALTTSDTIDITARVMESLTFCTSETDISGGAFGGSVTDVDCTFATTPDIVIGSGSPTAVLSSTAVDTTPAYFQISTNASNGAVVRMKALNTCPNGGLSSGDGSTCTDIPGIGDTPALMNAGTAAFGLYVSDSATTVGDLSSSGTVTPDSNYNDGTNDGATDHFFGMETGATGVTSTYGSVIASCTGPVQTVNTQLVFGATASLTTPAGIYTASESLIATGTF